MTSSPWSPYRPSAAAPWNLARAWTLRRRAGFAATWGELERDLAGGPEAAVDRVLAGECRTEGVPADFAQTADLLGDARRRLVRRPAAPGLVALPDALHARPAARAADARSGTTTSRPASSRSTTSPRCARRTRPSAGSRRGPFGDLLRAMLRDPALLVWLDAPSNRKGKPNENLARELMELFTLGVGHYSEDDVKEAARALTGRTVVAGRFRVRPDVARRRREDDPRQDRPVRRRLARRPPARPARGRRPARLAALPDVSGRRGRRRRRHSPTWPSRSGATACTSAGPSRRSSARRCSFRRGNLHTRVSDPVGFVVGSVRALERFAPPPSTLLLAEWTGRLGQELFFPPNVGGWPGGRRLALGPRGRRPGQLRRGARRGPTRRRLATLADLVSARRAPRATASDAGRRRPRSSASCSPAAARTEPLAGSLWQSAGGTRLRPRAAQPRGRPRCWRGPKPS